MRQRAFAVLLFLISGCAPAWAQAPDLIRLAPPDSGVLAGINLAQIRASDVGKSLLAKATSESSELKTLLATAGFDPLRDVDEIVIASPANSPKARGVFLLGGSFDPTRFAELAVAPGMSAETWHGVQVLTKQQEQPVAMACLNRTLIVGGDPETVRTTLARRNQAPGPRVELAAKAAEMRAAYDIWFVSHVSPADLTANAPDTHIAANPQLDLMRSIEQASGGLKFGSDFTMAADLTARTPKEAEDIAAALRLFIGLAASNQRDSKQAAAILEKLALATEGNTVKMSFSIPQAELVKSIEAAMERVRQTAPAAPAPPPPTDVKVYSSPKDMGVVTIAPPKP
jgi:hypothetical protein